MEHSFDVENIFLVRLAQMKSKKAMKVTDDRKNDRRRLRRPEVNRFLIGGSKNGDSQQAYCIGNQLQLTLL